MKRLLICSLGLFVFAIAIAGAMFVSGVMRSEASECPGDNDCDGFSNTLEAHVGTDHKDACGPNAWPPDFNNDTFVDIFDLALMAPFVGQTVPPAPVRFDIAPEPAGDNFIWLEDEVRLVNLFGQSCGSP